MKPTISRTGIACRIREMTKATMRLPRVPAWRRPLAAPFPESGLFYALFRVKRRCRNMPFARGSTCADKGESGMGGAAFKAARDFLLATRNDHRAACAGFRWPELDRFNWALDWFDA